MLSFGTKTFTWEGRQLTALSDSGSGDSLTYQYNDSGIRTKKVYNGVTTNCFLNGSDVVRKTNGTDTLDYFYDADGNLYGFKLNGTEYYYIRNGQNDITGILDTSGSEVVSYSYDTWGKLLGITGSLADTVGVKNPYRYRGYRYDTETGLFYLGSRYYNPDIGRFLNTDGIMGVNDDMATYNLYVYCGNNPVDRYDDGGMSWKKVIRALIHAGNTTARSFGIDTAAIGGFLLNMTQDKKGIYHASFNCWQQHAGYNDFYDWAFDAGSSMKPAKFQFSYGRTAYILWAWKGDYVNLGAGAELGIYYGGGPHWLVDKSLAMNMSLTLKYKGSIIISYSAKTWWITGFNPRYLNVNANKLTATFTVTFNSSGMFKAFRNSPNTRGWSFNSKNLSALYAF